MIAYDINPTTHQLTTRWTWTNNQGGSPWYGEGYHNYGIADVDWDGRDEICYGSMVIDDNGKGLSTTGYGHGDAQHCSDLDPYRWGQEIFACNEDAQGANYRDATTSKVYHWYSLGRDCGRAMAGNFTDEYPGSQCVAVGMGLLSTTTDKVLTSNTTGITQDYRIYWDGDLCEESLDGVGTEGNAAVYKFGQSDPIFTATGTKLCNWTKNTPSLQADILGDWREEIVARSEDNMSLRIYTTVDPTPWRNYTLLHDMQYRQAVCWQMCGYNQPPHVSYFLGKTEGFTVAPPPVMTNGRTVETTAITAADNNKHVMLCDPNGGNVTVADGASPYILTVNAFSHTQGSAPSECTTKNTAISTTYSTYTLTGGAFTGAMRLVKQGEGILSMSGNQTYTGETDLWGGTLKFDGTLPNSSVVMKRFSKLASTATFGKGISMEYGAEIIPGGADTKGTLTVDSLSMNFGAIIDFDIYSDGLASDMVKVNKKLTLGESTLTNGPAYSTPVFRFKQHNATGATMPAEGKYLIMSAAEVSGNLDNVTLEGLSGVKCYLQNESGNVYLVVEGLRSASDVTWVGNVDGTWNLADVMNFTDKKGESDFFVTGDNVTIDDNANTTAINVTSEIVPGSITVNNDEKSFSIGGDGEIGGTGSITKNGSAALTLSGTNSYTGGTIVNGGTLKVATLPNAQLQYSSIGSYQAGKTILQLNGGSTLMPTAAVNMGSNIHLGSAAGDGGTISTSYGFTMTGAFLGYNLTKNGSGTLTMSGSNSIKKTILSGGTIEMASDANGLLGDTVVFNSGTLRMCDSYGSYSTASWNLSVPKGKTGTLYGDSRCALTGALVGEGTLNVYAIASSSTPRCHFMGNWSKFAGTLNARSVSNCDFQLANGYGMPNATLNTVSGMNIVAQQENGSKTQTYSFAVGEVTGNGTLSTCNRWTIGDDGDFTFAGNIANAPFTKVGTGKMTITGVTAPTSVIVSAGTLCLNNSSAATGMLGTGALTVNKDAKLSGAGMLSNSLTTVNGTLQSGLSDYSLSGAIDFGGSNVVLNDGSTFASCINSKLFYLRLTNIGTMTIKSGTTIKVVVRSSFAPSVGDEYQIWSATTNNVDVSTLKLDLPSFGDWLVWDTSDLASGKLRIAGTDGLNSILAGGDVKCTVFRENGALVGTFNTAYDQIRNHLSGLPISHGVYIVQLKKDNRSWCLKMTK
jgi:autotransporter-associated beta strand protein